MQSNGEYLSPVPNPPLLNISVNCHKYLSLLQLTLNSHYTEDDSCTSQTISGLLHLTLRHYAALHDRREGTKVNR